MKAYYPMLKFITPDAATFITESIPYYVTTQAELVALDLKSAAIIVKVYDTSLENHVDLPVTVEYNELLEKVPVYGTKNDCDNACKTLNKLNKDKASLTVQRLSII
jgi:hypothetical protein